MTLAEAGSSLHADSASRRDAVLTRALSLTGHGSPMEELLSSVQFQSSGMFDFVTP